MSKKVSDSYTDVNTTELTLKLIRNGKAVATYPISIGKNGVGNREDSGKTPLGLHKICEKIGDGEPLGMQFKSREATGEVWTQKKAPQENLILTRICRLQGLEDGVNKGTRIDSFQRYIYIHGTNQIEALGKEAVSHGCILLSNEDCLTYFNQINEGEYVLIHQ